MKRNNPYNVDYVMKRDNVTREVAEDKVKDLKARTRIDRNYFVSKYGLVEGEKKYTDFVNKSKQNEANFILRYGEEGPIKREEFLQKKDCRSIEYFKEKYGEDWEQHRNNLISNWSYKMSLQGYIDRYGETEGREKYEDGEELYYEYCKKKDTFKVDYYINKYGEEEGRVKFYEITKRRSSIYRNLTNIYDKDQADTIYQKVLEEAKKEKESINNIKSKYKRFSKHGTRSYIANLFFSLLSEQIGHKNVTFGDKEISLIDKSTGKTYYYDFYDSSVNLIIEYNGKAFHPKEGDTNWVGPYGKSYEQAIQRDNIKKKIALDNGFSYLVVREEDAYTLKQMDQVITKIVEDYYA